MGYLLGAIFNKELSSLILICLAVLTVATVIRRVWFHPLSGIPGPAFAKVTDLYSAYHSWRGTMHLDVQRCHQRYGDLIRYGPNRMLSLHAPDLKEIYAWGKPFGKPHSYSTFVVEPDAWSTMTSIDKDLHRNLRRTFRSGVTSNALASHEPVILQNLHTYTAELSNSKGADGWTRSANMRTWNLCLGFDTIAELGLGLKANLLQNHDSDFILPALYIHERKMGLWEQIPTLSDIGFGKFLGASLLLFSPEAIKFQKWYDRFLSKTLILNKEEGQGIFSPAFQSGQGNTDRPGHNRAQMIAEGSNSTFSSSDGYGVLLSSFMHYLTQYPRVYDKLAAELRSRYQPGQKIEWSPELESIAYLRAVIDEMMRLMPPACGVHWRECESTGVVLGPNRTTVPVGSIVGMSLFSRFRDPRQFKDPVLFWPERWLPETLPEAELAAARQAFKPFLVGPRGCPGGHVAIMIISIAATHLLVNFDFKLGSESRKPMPHLWSNTSGEIGSSEELRFESHYTTTTWYDGPYIQLKARNPVGDA